MRRDLRLTDNPALQAALQRGGAIVPLHIDDPTAARPAGAASRWWLHHSLAALSDDLAMRGSALLVRRGPPLSVLRQVVTECAATAVYWNRLYEPEAVERDGPIKAALRADGIEARSFGAALWAEPWTLQTGGGKPFKVFSPFWRTLSQQLPQAPVVPAPDRVPSPPRWPAGLALDALELRPRIAWDSGLAQHWQPGEASALRRLEAFVDAGLDGYHHNRDQPGIDGVSRLSPHLHFGEVGPRQVLAAVRRRYPTAPPELEPRGCRDGEHFLRELGWREFAHHLLYHFPQTPDRPLYARFDAFPWRTPADSAADLDAWRHGRTGIPIVDAGMRELWRTGWMHNRVRMIVASLLTKNLLIPWQEGAAWFWDTLVDADLANNTLGWQWTAGCGADAAPYFRVFNPVLQSRKFDPDGSYLRRWLPELADLPDRELHEPWLGAAAAARGYPAPIVDLRASRQRALAAYEAVRAGAPVQDEASD
ncbi:MAG: deoxyribodipyrimidine photo-lyase [Nevskiales bacterium]|nr:deoxyribodipyrimidine photo-lyase [Nevskiales bacterium]